MVGGLGNIGIAMGGGTTATSATRTTVYGSGVRQVPDPMLEKIQELQELSDFVAYLCEVDPEIGKHWIAFKARKRIGADGK